MKAVEAENKKRLDEKKKGSGSKTPVCLSCASQTPEFKDGKPLFGSKPAPAGECRSLFDAQTETAEPKWAGRRRSVELLGNRGLNPELFPGVCGIGVPPLPASDSQD